MRPRAAAPAAALVGLLAACGGSSGGPSPAPTPTPPAGRVFEYNGVTHVSWWHDEYGYPAGGDARRTLAATGAGWMGLLTTWYMPTRSSSTIARDPDRSNDDDVVRRAIDEAHALGLKVMLKPHVDVKDGTWRAQIAPSDTGAWFDSYAAFIEHHAAIAAEKNVAMLCVGTELISMTRSPYAGDWARVIARVRGRYAGTLVYAANANDAADEFTSASLWPLVDVLGLDVYTPLTAKTDPTRAELVAAWRRNRDGHDMLAAYRGFQQAWGKPLVFTEVGYRSADGANRAPWDWGASLAADPAEQADCYAALYEVWSREEAWFRGPFWWSWDVAGPKAGDTGYNPRGKSAEEVLRQWQR
jgi:hypothetical protein